MWNNSTKKDNLQQDEENNLIHFSKVYHSMTPLQQSIFWKLRYYCTKYIDAFPAQSTIANKLKCSITSVYHVMELLKTNGFLQVNKRDSSNGKFTTRIYKLNDFLIKNDLKSILKKYGQKRCVPMVSLNEKPSQSTFKGCSKTPNKIVLNINTLNTNKESRKSMFKEEKLFSSFQKSKPLIKKIFIGSSFKEKDQIAFSKYSDEEIEEARKVFNFQTNKIGMENIKNPTAFFQKLLWKAKHGILNDLLNLRYAEETWDFSKKFDLRDLGSKYAEFPDSALTQAYESFSWYVDKIGKDKIRNPHSLFFTIAKQKMERLRNLN